MKNLVLICTAAMFISSGCREIPIPQPGIETIQKQEIPEKPEFRATQDFEKAEAIVNKESAEPVVKKEEVKELVNQLASEEYRTRRKAIKEIRTLLKGVDKKQGKTLIAWLQEHHDKSEDAEVVYHLEKIIDMYLRPWRYFEPLRILKGHKKAIHSVAFSPDSKLLVSAGEDCTVRIWDAKTGRCIKILEHSSVVRSVAFSPDGKLIASAGANANIHIWNANSGKCMRTIKGSGGSIWDIEFSPSKDLLASANYNGTIDIWNPSTGEKVHTLKKHSLKCIVLAFSKEGTLLASGGEDEEILIWDTKTWECLQKLIGHTGIISSLAFSPDTKLLASGGYGYKGLKIWELSTDKKPLDPIDYIDWIKSVAFSPDGKMLVSVGEDCQAKIWNPETGEYIQEIGGCEWYLESVVFNKEGTLIATISRSLCIIWGIPER